LGVTLGFLVIVEEVEVLVFVACGTGVLVVAGVAAYKVAT